MKYKRLFLILLGIGIISSNIGCGDKQLECDHKSSTNLSIALVPVNYILHSFSKYYFLSNLKTFTYYKNSYYNIDPDNNKFYQFSFASRNADTTDIFITRELTLDFKPVDFCINDSALYILSDERNATLFKFLLKQNNNSTFDIISNTEVLKNAFMLPNARLSVSNDQFATCWFNLLSDETAYMHFNEYDLTNKKVVSSIQPEILYQDNLHYPSMESPYRLDRGLLSIVSFGFENNIRIYNRRSGIELGRYCANSKNISSITGLTQPDVSDIQKPLNYLIGNAHYLDVIYDIRNNYYYRIAKHSQQVKDNKTLKLSKIENSPWSLIVLDTNYTVINEINIPERKLNFLYHFNNDDGVHFLSLEKNTQVNDDFKLQFSNLRIK